MRSPMNRRPNRRPILAGMAAGTLLLGGALSGCGALSADSAEGEQNSLNVVAAFYPLQFAAERVMGDLGSVENLTTPGGEPHDLELGPAQTAQIAEAGVVVYLNGFQSAVDEAVEQSATGDAYDVTSTVDLEPIAADHADEHAEEEGEHAEEHAEEAHDHGDLDPHFWLDPIRMADVGDELAAHLGEVYPDHAEEFTQNAAALRSDLEALDAAYTSGLANCERNMVVVSHDAFGYLGKYGIDVHSIVGLSPEAEPNPQVLAQLQGLIDQEGITTVFSETLVDPEIAESLAADTGVESAVLDPIEGLTDETANQDYIDLMNTNLTALETANGCTNG